MFPTLKRDETKPPVVNYGTVLVVQVKNASTEQIGNFLSKLLEEEIYSLQLGGFTAPTAFCHMYDMDNAERIQEILEEVGLDGN